MVRLLFSLTTIKSLGQCCRTSYLAIFYIVDTRSLALAKINAVKNQAVCILKMPGVPLGRACDGCRRQKKKVCPQNHEVAKRSLLRLPQVRLCDTMFTVCSPGVRMRRIWAAKVPFQKSKVLSTSSALRRRGREPSCRKLHALSFAVAEQRAECAHQCLPGYNKADDGL